MMNDDVEFETESAWAGLWTVTVVRKDETIAGYGVNVQFDFDPWAVESWYPTRKQAAQYAIGQFREAMAEMEKIIAMLEEVR